jgi:hypothetical protein
MEPRRIGFNLGKPKKEESQHGKEKQRRENDCSLRSVLLSRLADAVP